MLNMCGPKHVVKVCGYFACSGHPKHIKIILKIKKKSQQNLGRRLYEQVPLYCTQDIHNRRVTFSKLFIR